MASLAPYSITLGATDYPVKYAGLLAYIEPFLTNLETFSFSGTNVGLGVTPSAWSGLGAALQVNRLSLVTGGASNVDSYMTSNGFWNGSGWRYIGTAAATQYTQNVSGDHRWWVAPSGTAGNAISFTQAMTLDANGYLGVGMTNPVGRVTIKGAAGSSALQQLGFQYQGSSSYFMALGLNSASGDAQIMSGSGAALIFYTNSNLVSSNERARITSGGDLLVGTTSDGAAGLGISNLLNLTFPEGSGTSYANLFRQAGSGATILANGYKCSANSNALASSVGTSWAKSAIGLGAGSGGTITFYTDPAGTVANGTDVTPTPRATITSGGDLLIGATGSAFAEKLRVFGNYVVFDNASYSGLMGQGSSLGTATASDFGIRSANAIAFLTNGANERARITSGGDLLVGTTGSLVSAVSRFRVSTGAAPAIDAKNTSASDAVVDEWNSATSGDNQFQRFWTEGTATQRGSIDYNRAGGLVRYNTTSDYRAKDIIGPVQNPGAVIDALKVYEGRMKGATQSRPMMIAHEAQELVPFCVSGEKDGEDADGNPILQQMDHASLVPLLIAETQSLRARVAALEAA